MVNIPIGHTKVAVDYPGGVPTVSETLYAADWNATHFTLSAGANIGIISDGGTPPTITVSAGAGGSSLSGGTVNFVPLWASPTTLTTSLIQQNTAAGTVSVGGGFYAGSISVGNFFDSFQNQIIFSRLTTDDGSSGTHGNLVFDSYTGDFTFGSVLPGAGPLPPAFFAPNNDLRVNTNFSPLTDNQWSLGLLSPVRRYQNIYCTLIQSSTPSDSTKYISIKHDGSNPQINVAGVVNATFINSNFAPSLNTTYDLGQQNPAWNNIWYKSILSGGSMIVSGITNNGNLFTSAFQMSSGASNNFVLTSDGAGNGTWQAAAGGALSGGTTNAVPRWASATTLTNSIIAQQNATQVSVGGNIIPSDSQVNVATLGSLGSGFKSLYLANDNSAQIRTQGGNLSFDTSLLPTTDSSQTLGNNSFRWSSVRTVDIINAGSALGITGNGNQMSFDTKFDPISGFNNGTLYPLSDENLMLGQPTRRLTSIYFSRTVSFGGDGQGSTGSIGYSSNTSVAMAFGKSAVAGNSAALGAIADKILVMVNGVVRVIPVYVS